MTHFCNTARKVSLFFLLAIFTFSTFCFADSSPDSATLLSQVQDRVSERYFRPLTSKELEPPQTVEQFLQNLDPDTRLEVLQAPTKDFIRGLEREESITDRRIISGDSVKNTKPIGYARILFFGRRTAYDFQQWIQNVPPLSGFIIDIRGNPGGNLEESLKLSSLWVEREETVGFFQGRDSKKLVTTPVSNSLMLHLRTTLLIDEGTSSSAEFFAWVLKQYGKAILVGKRSHGKASVQEGIPLSSDRRLWLTVGHLFLPDGRSFQGVGVEPDYWVKEPDQGIRKAIEALTEVLA